MRWLKEFQLMPPEKFPSASQSSNLNPNSQSLKPKQKRRRRNMKSRFVEEETKFKPAKKFSSAGKFRSRSSKKVQSELTLDPIPRRKKFRSRSKSTSQTPTRSPQKFLEGQDVNDGKLVMKVSDVGVSHGDDYDVDVDYSSCTDDEELCEVGSCRKKGFDCGHYEYDTFWRKHNLIVCSLCSTIGLHWSTKCPGFAEHRRKLEAKLISCTTHCPGFEYTDEIRRLSTTGINEPRRFFRH